MPRISDPAKLEARSQRQFGCSFEQSITLNDSLPLQQLGSKARLYTAQRLAAAKRGVEWRISFPEWLSVWMESGHWHERGRGAGRYCMARHGDVGPYSVANVSIQLCTKNSSDGIAKARNNLATRGLKMGSHSLGAGRGWTFVARAKHNPYQVVVAKKYIGCFPTQAAAEAAYVKAAAAHSEDSSNAPIFFRSSKNEVVRGGNAR